MYEGTFFKATKHYRNRAKAVREKKKKKKKGNGVTKKKKANQKTNDGRRRSQTDLDTRWFSRRVGIESEMMEYLFPRRSLQPRYAK